MLYVTFCSHGYQRTKRIKYTSPLLPGTPLAETPPIRGPARLSGRGPSRQRRGPRLRLLPQLLPRPLSPFPQRNPSRFFLSPRHGPQSQPKKSAARDLIIKLRKQNHSVYEISQILKDRQCSLSPTGVREVLRAEGFAPLP